MRNYDCFIQRMKGQNGFTLIEVMITLGVVTLALFGLLSATTMIQASSIGANERAVAIQHANQVIENMRNLAVTSLSSVTASYSNSGTVASSAYTSSSNEALPSETVTVTYADGADAGTSVTDDNPLDATVTVNWQLKGVRSATEVVRTLIARRQ